MSSRRICAFDMKRAKGSARLVFGGCGKQDAALEENRAFAALLEKNGVRQVFKESAGGHSWLTWRELILELLPRLFRG